MPDSESLDVIDSHTAGEATRLIVSGGPELGNGPLEEQVQRLRQDHDRIRTATVNEPRGSGVIVGALLCPSSKSECFAGVIFFNNVGYLGMCGHGMIGVIESLRYAGHIVAGVHRIETPVGVVRTRLDNDGSVTIENVPSYRKASEVRLQVDGIGTVVGDVAWGGNWFFLVREPHFEISRDRVGALHRVAESIRQAVIREGFPEVDHVELFDDVVRPGVDSKNFVLCPGGEYDRSPCGTGTSAKMACLAAEGRLQSGDPWVQEGVLGTTFAGSYQWRDRDRTEIIPSITGTAYVMAEGRLIMRADDPFAAGIDVTPPAEQTVIRGDES